MPKIKVCKMMIKPKNNNLPKGKKPINMQNFHSMEKEKLNKIIKLSNNLLFQMNLSNWQK